MTALSPPVLRVVPAAWFPGRRANLLLERNARVAWRVWPIYLSGFFEPVFYLLSIGVGLGHLVGRVGDVSYAQYVAPALLATSAMNGAIYDSTMNVYYKLTYAKVYDAVLATPMDVPDVAIAELCWCLFRGVVYSTIFLAMMAALGDLRSWWALAALPTCALIGFAFSAAGIAATTFVRSWNDFELIQLVVMPLFLFSGTFSPLSSYPGWLRPVIQLSPLYHGVALMRQLTLGGVTRQAAIHLLVLLGVGLAGSIIAIKRLRILLQP
jgi:lipooligosaccharide transport system permease protein